jgi:stress-induced morphogen
LVYADDVNLVEDNINTIKKSTEALTDANEVGLEVNTENHVHIETCHQDVGQNYNVNIANRSFENVVKIKHLDTIVKI